MPQELLIVVEENLECVVFGVLVFGVSFAVNQSFFNAGLALLASLTQ
jgi:hypothetical protein